MHQYCVMYQSPKLRALSVQPARTCTQAFSTARVQPWITLLSLSLCSLVQRSCCRLYALLNLTTAGVTDAITWNSLLGRLPQLRQDTISKVASGAAAAVVEWGRHNAGSSASSMARGGGNSSSRSGGGDSSTRDAASSRDGDSDSSGRASFEGRPPASWMGSSGDIASRADPVGVNFFSDICEMAAEEAREQAEGRRSSSSSSSSSSSDEDGPGTQGGTQTASNGRTDGGSSSSSSSSSSSLVGRGLPELAQGDDDIEWVSVLHRGLQSAGYYPSEEECEDWLFAESTQVCMCVLEEHGLAPALVIVWQTNAACACTHHRSGVHCHVMHTSQKWHTLPRHAPSDSLPSPATPPLQPASLL